jgi:hypothetical protein
MRGTTLTLKPRARVLLHTDGEGRTGGERRKRRRRSLTEKLKREKQVCCTARGHPRHYFAHRGAARSARGVDEGSRERSGKRLDGGDASISRFAESMSRR